MTKFVLDPSLANSVVTLTGALESIPASAQSRTKSMTSPTVMPPFLVADRLAVLISTIVTELVIANSPLYVLIEPFFREERGVFSQFHVPFQAFDRPPQGVDLMVIHRSSPIKFG
jgi:hypothetical protein